MKDLDLVKITLNKFKTKFHEVQSGEYTYIAPYDDGDIKNNLYVKGHGLVELTNANQLWCFMEFQNGVLVSY